MGFLGGVFGSKERVRFGDQALAMVRGQRSVASAEFDAKEFVIRYWTQGGSGG
ncbi:hypothetical protein [Nocardia crassostreae]|uniref:hypothetical protein n=1 Tax=Nocardia crassostreae TaxID=53428 RepID=UPI000A78D005|nr:hypothetical protein [Nocardia crassostreae]